MCRPRRPLLKRLFSLVSFFQEASGSQLNVAKSKGLVMGDWREDLPRVCPVAWTQDPIKINGVWVGPGDLSARNWADRIGKLEAAVDKWSRRKLSLVGKTVVVNSVLVPLLYYVAPVYPLPASLSRRINSFSISF